MTSRKSKDQPVQNGGNDKSIKPGVQASAGTPGQHGKITKAREVGDRSVAVARFAGFNGGGGQLPGANAPGFMLPPASQAENTRAAPALD